MLNKQLPIFTELMAKRLQGAPLASFVVIIGIVLGSMLGYFLPRSGEWLGNGIDYTLLLLVGSLFFGIDFGKLFKVSSRLNNVYFIAIALLANFFFIPLIGYIVASLFLWQQPLLMIGLVIYFMSPCTDWFLSFTRLSEGNVGLGAALVPINIILQLLFYPLYLQFFTAQSVQIDAISIGDTLLQWFLLPMVIALIARQLLQFLLRVNRFEYLIEVLDKAVPWITAILVLQIFAGNISVLVEHITMFIWVLLCVFTFFLLTWVLGRGLSKVFRLHYPEHALLTMTIAARNAPLMLVVTVVALPDQPLIYGALVIGMLVEIPHLTLLRHILLKDRRRRITKHSSDVVEA